MELKVGQLFKKYYEGVLSLFYPEFCEICSKELNSQNDFFCFRCEQKLHYTHFEKYKDTTTAEEMFWGRLYLQNVYSLLYYAKGNSTQNILHSIKYKNKKELGIFMGKMIGEKLKTSPKYKGIDALIPIPLHSKKEFIRGYNQSQLIAEGVGQELGVPVVKVLYRKTHDVSQTKMSKEERYTNVQGRFYVKPNFPFDYKHVLIVDDVLTTGSTIEFASRAISNVFPDTLISIATIAKAQDG